jgi:hypothetical protein
MIFYRSRPLATAMDGGGVENAGAFFDRATPVPFFAQDVYNSSDSVIDIFIARLHHVGRKRPPTSELIRRC